MKSPVGFVEGLPNCGIVAIAAATGTPYDDVWRWFKQRRGHNGNWKGRTHSIDYLPALRHFGKTLSYRDSWFDGTRLRLDDVGALIALEPGQTCIVRVRGHVVLMRGVMVLDNWHPEPRHVVDHPRRGAFVKEVFVVA